MKSLLGVFMIISGIVLVLFVGIWLMFVGGIIAIVYAIQMDTVNGGEVAHDIVRIVFSSLVGGISFYALIIPGFILLTKDWRMTKKKSELLLIEKLYEKREELIQNILSYNIMDDDGMMGSEEVINKMEKELDETNSELKKLIA